MHRDGGRGQDAGVHAANLTHAKRAVRQDVGNHKRDFILVRRKHHARRGGTVRRPPGRLLDGDHVIERVYGNAVAERLKAGFQPLGHLALMPAGAVLRGHTFQIVKNVHLSLPFPVTCSGSLLYKIQ